MSLSWARCAISHCEGFCVSVQHTERRYEEAFENARKPISTGGTAAGSGAGGAVIDTEGLRQGAHANINQVRDLNLVSFTRRVANKYHLLWRCLHKVLRLSVAACVLQVGLTADHEGALCTQWEGRYLNLLLTGIPRAHGGGFTLQGHQAAKSGIGAAHGQAKAGADQAADTAASQVCAALSQHAHLRALRLPSPEMAQFTFSLHVC